MDKPLKIHNIIPELYPRVTQYYKGNLYDGNGNLIPSISNPYEYRILISDGTNTGSIGYSNFVFNSSSLIIGNSSINTTIDNQYIIIQNSTESLRINATGIYNINEIKFDSITESNIVPTQSLLYYDRKRESLAYYSDSVLDSPIFIGQQHVTRIYNILGFTLSKGQAVYISGSTESGVPYVNLSNSSIDSTSIVEGLIKDNIPPYSYGLIVNNGIIDNVDIDTLVGITASVGDSIYLSDKISGSFITDFFGLSYSSRRCKLGEILLTGTQGSIYTDVSTEELNLSISERKRNILEGRIISSGAFILSTQV